MAVKTFIGFVIAIFSACVGEAASCKPTRGRIEDCKITILFAGQTRDFRYEVRRPLGQAPTVVDIPGGPGQGYFGEIEQAAIAGNIPDHFGILAIDPRGVGVNNYGPDLSGRDYGSDLQVEDLLKVIQGEQLSNYLIHGQSYGTMVAVKLASRLENQKTIALPKAVVLAGIVEGAFSDQIKGYNDQLSRLTRALSTEQKMDLKQHFIDLINDSFHSDSKAFSLAIMQALMFNVEVTNSAFGPNTPSLAVFISMMSSGQVDRNQILYSMFDHFALQMPRSASDFSKFTRENSMAEQVRCTEMTTTGKAADISFNAASFQIELVHSDCEKNGYRITRPFRSSDYQISHTPIFYFQGDIDPATPFGGAKLHYLSQKSSEKIFVGLHGYAHLDLLALSNCKDGLWESLTAGRSQAQKFISNCSDPNVRIIEP